MKIIVFTYDLISAPIIYHWLREGNTVVVAQIQNVEELKNEDKPEHPDCKKKRLENYDGVFDKYDARKVLKRMQTIKNKDEWFIFFDFNNLWRYAEVVQKMGFKNGFFPTHEDHLLEKDRQMAKDIVEKEYPDLKLTEVTEFKKKDDAIKHMEENPDKRYVLKGNSDDAKTFVPSSEIPELAAKQIADTLENNPQVYEKNGFILEEMIQDPIELTPEIVFYNGEVIFTNVDIENKPVGSGNLGDQTGCAQCIVVKTELEDKINKIAFPEYVYKKAKEHRGMFVWDASILIDPKDGSMYFGEFCSNRLGWDSVFAEIMMSNGATLWLQNIMNGTNPLIHKFGATVRGFNFPEKKDGEEWGLEECDMEWITSEDKKIFLYEMKIEGEKATNIGTSSDLVVFASAADNLPQAVNSTYKGVKGFSFQDLYFRPKFDFMSEAYPTSIPNRLKYYNETFAKNDNSDNPAQETSL